MNDYVFIRDSKYGVSENYSLLCPSGILSEDSSHINPLLKRMKHLGYNVIASNSFLGFVQRNEVGFVKGLYIKYVDNDAYVYEEDLDQLIGIEESSFCEEIRKIIHQPLFKDTFIITEFVWKDNDIWDDRTFLEIFKNMIEKDLLVDNIDAIIKNKDGIYINLLSINH